MYKRFVELIPLATVILIYFSYCSLVGYYSAFDIDIYNFIDTAELVTSFIYLANKYVWIGLIAVYIVLQNLKWFDLKPDAEKLNTLAICLACVLVQTGMLVTDKFFSYKSAQISLRSGSTYIGVLPLAFTLCTIVIISGLLILKEKLGAEIAFITSVIFLGITIQGLRNWEAHFYFKHVASITNVISFTHGFSSIKSSDSLYYVGGTKNYIFMCQRDTARLNFKKTFVYDRGKIDNLTIVSYINDSTSR